MPVTDRAPAFLPVSLDTSAWSQPWADASLAWQHQLITLLDLQTAWWRDAERQAAGWMQVWMAPVATAAPFMPPGWDAWARVWVNALQHDAEER